MDDPTNPPADEEAAAPAAAEETNTENTDGGEAAASAASGSEGGDNNNNIAAAGGGTAMRPVFLGNLHPTYTHDDVVNIFHKPVVPPGTEDAESFKPVAVDRLDQKRGYCFVFLKDAESPGDKDNVEKLVSAINGM